MGNNSPVRAPRKPIEANEWVSVVEAARRLDVAPQTIYNRALAGELETMRIAGRIVVHVDSIQRALGNDP